MQGIVETSSIPTCPRAPAPWTDAPLDIFLRIAEVLDVQDILSLQQVGRPASIQRLGGEREREERGREREKDLSILHLLDKRFNRFVVESALRLQGLERGHLASLRAQPLEVVREELVKFCGIGRKVAGLMCLYLLVCIVILDLNYCVK